MSQGWVEDSHLHAILAKCNLCNLCKSLEDVDAAVWPLLTHPTTIYNTTPSTPNPGFVIFLKNNFLDAKSVQIE